MPWTPTPGGVDAEQAVPAGILQVGPDRPERIRNLILPSKSLQYARERARHLVDRARRALEAVPDGEARRALDTMAEFVVTRPM